MPRPQNRAAALRRSIQIKAPPEKVYDAFRTNEALSLWYMDGSEVALEPGGMLAFDGPEGSVGATFTELVENQRLVMDYHAPWWGTVTWSLKATPKGTRVTLEHAGFEGREDWLERFSWGWESFLKALKAYVEGRPIK